MSWSWPRGDVEHLRLMVSRPLPTLLLTDELTIFRTAMHCECCGAWQWPRATLQNWMNGWAVEYLFDQLIFVVCIQLKGSEECCEAWYWPWGFTAGELRILNTSEHLQPHQLWMTAAIIWRKTPHCCRTEPASVVWNGGEGEQTKCAITTEWLSTDYWTLWEHWWIGTKPRSQSSKRKHHQKTWWHFKCLTSEKCITWCTLRWN